MLSLCCCTVACSSCHAQVSHCAGFSCCGARPLGAWASVVAVRGLSCSMVCGIFADQESNLYTFIHCTTRELYHQGTVPPGNCASRELYRQGSPYNFFFLIMWTIFKVSIELVTTLHLSFMLWLFGLEATEFPDQGSKPNPLH